MTFWQVVNESAEGCEAPCLNAWVEAKVEGGRKLENWRAESSDQLGMLATTQPPSFARLQAQQDCCFVHELFRAQSLTADPEARRGRTALQAAQKGC